MSRLLALVLAGAILAPAWGLDVVHEWTWTELRSSGALGAVTPESGGNVVIASPSGASSTIHLATLRRPNVTADQSYGLLGRIRYHGVTPQGYLEMWNVLPNGRRYFSRTLVKGRMGPLFGDSDWREFALVSVPARGPRIVERQRALELNLVLPGSGTVELDKTLRLVRFDSQPEAVRYASGGLGLEGSLFGVIGGILGTIVGLLGAALGILLAIGRPRLLVYILDVALAVVGAIMIATAMVLFSLPGEGFGFVPFIVTGFIAVALAGILFLVARRRFHADDLRRMQAMDCSR